jgi:hypothetical protein
MSNALKVGTEVVDDDGTMTGYIIGVDNPAPDEDGPTTYTIGWYLLPHGPHDDPSFVVSGETADRFSVRAS